ncbi:hypothetical protein LRAMOSA04478 [Lichtheimia ramosa]|uniref:Uncharacterized protein n=1 Tax=Lichtheimia ramosa TaxID=688394 RepID=A0A077WZ08_9FUNG|nr:hypothetical protein LRAMOSA04478 [Lichtheimia ramosa]
MSPKDFSRLVSSARKPIQLEDYAGKTVAINAEALMQESVTKAPIDWAIKGGTVKYLDYFFAQMDILKQHDIVPWVVFGGNSFLCNRLAQQQKQRCQQEALDKGLAHLQDGDQEKALTCFQDAVHVTPDMVDRVKKYLLCREITFMEAPYEVGGQLSFLAAQNHVDAVITTTDNDTVADLLAYGCPVIITSMDQDGTATKITFQDSTFSTDINLTGWDVKAIHSLYLLSGACKQLPTLPNMDTHVAHKLLSHHNHNIHSTLFHLEHHKIFVPSGYIEAFERLLKSRIKQMIFDPVLWGIVPLRLENSCVNIVIKIRKPDPDEKPAKLPKWYCKPCTKENEENYPEMLHERYHSRNTLRQRKPVRFSRSLSCISGPKSNHTPSSSSLDKHELQQQDQQSLVQSTKRKRTCNDDDDIESRPNKIKHSDKHQQHNQSLVQSFMRDDDNDIHSRPNNINHSDQQLQSNASSSSSSVRHDQQQHEQSLIPSTKRKRSGDDDDDVNPHPNKRQTL